MKKVNPKFTLNENIIIANILRKQKAKCCLLKFYDLDTILNFGKYKGKTLKDVASENIMYIEWCIMNVDFFVISSLTKNEIKEINAGFLCTEETNEKLLEKIDEYDDEQLWQQQKEENRQSNEYESNWDSEYYDDSRDLDEQNPEWYDSL